MTPEMKARWITALRSGGYAQGTGRLRTANNEFCCLGVLCDLHDPERWKKDQSRWSYAGENAILPHKLSNDLKIFSANAELPFYDRRPERVYLTELNDNGFTFSQIADLIEYFY